MKVIDIVAGRAIEFRNKTLRVVAMPGESNLLVAGIKAKLELMQLNNAYYIVKPVDMPDLKTKIEEVLSGK